MKVTAFNGSARPNGNTSIAIETVLKELRKEGVRTEVVNLAGKDLHGCRACFKCFGKKNKRCAHDDDAANECIAAMVESDGIIIGSPVYFSSMSAQMKALVDRAGFVAKANDDMFKRMVGAAVVAVRRAGGCSTFMQINQFFMIGQMIVAGSSYWNVGYGLEPGDIVKDEEGLNTFATLGVNMAWLLRKLHA
jgi:multimeric flavodoxin WrbA